MYFQSVKNIIVFKDKLLHFCERKKKSARNHNVYYTVYFVHKAI